MTPWISRTALVRNEKRFFHSYFSFRVANLSRADTLLWRKRGKPNNGRTTPLVEEADRIEHREFPVPASACSDPGHNSALLRQAPVTPCHLTPSLSPAGDEVARRAPAGLRGAAS